MEVHSNDRRLGRLAHLRDVVAYFYAAPHEVFGYVFLSQEEISLALFTPARVSIFLTRPNHHTEITTPVSGPEPDSFHYILGNNGLYNFRHTFWVEPGSRLYGPKPQMTLNISQDLSTDIEHRISAPIGQRSWNLRLSGMRRGPGRRTGPPLRFPAKTTQDPWPFRRGGRQMAVRCTKASAASMESKRGSGFLI
jgi:hypothetical protein